MERHSSACGRQRVPAPGRSGLSRAGRPGSRPGGPFDLCPRRVHPGPVGALGGALRFAREPVRRGGRRPPRARGVAFGLPPRITVVGSINLDLVAFCERLPRPGETLTDAELERVPGGKGANQAVAAARLGAEVTFVGCVGDDEFARLATSGLEEAGVDLSGLQVTEDEVTGVAVILVDRGGENQ